VGYELPLDSYRETLAELGGDGACRSRQALAIVGQLVPAPATRHRSLPRNDGAAGLELFDTLEQGAGRRRPEVGEVIVQRDRIDGPAHVRALHDRLELRCEQHAARCRGDIERFDANRVANEEQITALDV